MAGKFWTKESPLWKRIWWKVSRLFWWRRKKESERSRQLVFPRIDIEQMSSVLPMTAETGVKFEERQATPEEVEDSRRSVEQMDAIERFVKTMGRDFTYDFSYTIPCPCCGGSMRFSKSSWNDHRVVECQTDGCGSWRE